VVKERQLESYIFVFDRSTRTDGTGMDEQMNREMENIALLQSLSATLD